MAHQTKEPTPIRELNPDVPADLVAIIERLMKKSPEQRYASTKELVQVLQPLAGEIGPTLSRQVSRRSRSDSRHARRIGPTARAAKSPSNSRHGANSPTSVSPSTPTPKPAALGSLPSRSTLFRKEAAPPQEKSAPEPAAEVQQDPAQAVAPSAPVKSELLEREERLGTLGFTVSAIAACILVFFVARILNVF